jgi:hypothetical protein
MTTRRFVGVAAGLLLASLPVAASLPTPTAAAASERLTVIDQGFNIERNGTLDVTLSLPAGVTTQQFDSTTRIVVAGHSVVADRPTMLKAFAGTLTRVDDRVTIPLDPAAPLPTVTTPSADTISLSIPTESDQRTRNALQLNGVGIHPITFELSVGDISYDATTFVNRLDGDSTTPDAMSVAIVMGQTLPPSVASDGSVSVSSNGIDELRRLAAALTAMDAVPAALGLTTGPPPRAVAIEPSTMEALTRDQPDLAAELTPLLGESALVARPRLPLDPGSAVAASDESGSGDALYTRWLREGEDLLSTLVTGRAVERSVYTVDQPLTSAGAALRRDLGTRLLVMPYDEFAQLDGSTGALTDTTQLVSAELPDDASLPIAVVDPSIAGRIAKGADDPLGTAIQVVSDLVVTAQEITDTGEVVSRHGMVLALTDLGIPDPAVLGELTSLLLTTPTLELVEPSRFVSSVSTWINNGRPVTVSLGDAAPVDLSARFALIGELDANSTAFASMLVDDVDTADRWRQVLDTMPTTAISDAEARTMGEGLRSEFTTLQQGIEVQASSFTLTSKNSEVRFSLSNTTSADLRVRVSLDSPKIRFPGPDQLVTVPAGEAVGVTAQAQALSNGKSDVFLRIFTPEGDNVAVVPELVLTARINSFAGAGPLVTGAALLLVITWWIRHWRLSRRRQLASLHVPRHPSAASGDDDESDGELSPDAAATNLPPS